MSKLGYTWYPKDWTNSESVFELNLSERGLYRELIDLAMLNDNETIINSAVWCRKFDISHDDLWSLIEKLEKLLLIVITNESDEDKPIKLLIPSCEPRLNLVRGGKNGGKKSRKDKPTSKPIVKPVDKPTPNQIESKLKEKKSNISFLEKKEAVIVWFNNHKEKHTGKKGRTKGLSKTDENNLKTLIKDYTSEDFERAIPNMFSNQWAKDNQIQTLTHFLRVDNFNKYLNQEPKPTNKPHQW